MTHFLVAVRIDRDDHKELAASDFATWNLERITAAVSGQLEPYSEQGEWFKDGSRWDWWVIGGRWSGLPNLMSVDRAREIHNTSLLFEQNWRPVFLHKHNWHEQRRMGWFGDDAKTECEVRGKTVARCRWKDEKIEALLTCYNEDDKIWVEMWAERFLSESSENENESLIVLVDCHV